MDPAPIIRRLQHTPAVFASLVSGLPLDEVRFRPPAGAWSILEIVNHLADEEREDFRARVRCIIETPGVSWPPIDPEVWAQDRNYQAQDPRESLDRFVRERAESVRWLRSLGDVDWRLAYKHPKFGPISAGDLLVAWAAHDALHIRQIAKRLFELAARDGEADGFKTRYAGEWKA